MLSEISSDELEKEIILIQQELYVKRSLLDEYRKKLTDEISEHMQTKSTAAKHLNENNELKNQLEINFAATKKFEEEMNKNREILIKFQVQMETYKHERLQLLDKCFAAENENMVLKRELAELQQKLSQSLVFQDNFKSRLSKTEALVNEAMIKQEVLNKDHNQLEVACKETLKYAEKFSEECKFQMKFVREANMGHRKMEEEMIRLMTAFRKLKTASRKYSPKKEELQNYLEEWKLSQEEMGRRQKELEDGNKRLQEELKLALEQNEIYEKKLTPDFF